MFKRILELFLPKVGELLANYAHKKVGSMKDFNLTFESLRRNLKSLSAKAFDIEEQVNNAELSGKKKRKREIDNWFEEVKLIEAELLRLENELQSEGFISRFIGGGRVEELNQRVDVLMEQSQHFGELLLDVYETKGELLLTTMLVGKGFEINLERLWRLLVTEKVTRIGIYGMGGVGKTTLMKHIHNRLLEKTQECIFWVTVSHVFTVKMLQDEIARTINLDLSDEDNEDKRATRLHRALSLKKSTILMLDDVWRKIDLERVGYPFSAEACRLVLTTRSLEVCRQIGCQEMISVKTLQTDEAWHLFSETLKGTKLTPPVEKVAKHLAKCCGGLPLGIITLAGSMRGETVEYEWSNALEELKEPIMGQEDTEDQVFKVLKYSFDRLNPSHEGQGQSIYEYSPLQLCFLYCSLYPEDYEIERGELVRKFISEELTDKRPCWKAQLDLGHSILNKLVNVCLLERTFRYGLECVKMHDLVRAMALKITKHKTRVIAGDYSLKELPREEEWTIDLEKMSLMRNGIEETPPGISPNCPNLSTLILQGNPLELVSDSFFSHMHGLCILDLSWTHVKELPDSLSDLTRLKALLLHSCRYLEYVPYLGKLKAMRELDLSGTAIKEVPQGIEELVSLKFLSLYAPHLQMVPIGLLLKLSHLQFLEFPDQIKAPLEEIEGLKQLEEFRGAVKDFSDFNRLIRSWESRVCDIFSNIVIRNPQVRREVLVYDASIVQNRVRLHEYNFKKGEEKDESILGEDIQHLLMRDCEGLSDCLLDDFPRFGNPRSLKSLELVGCEGIECLLKSEHLMASNELQSQYSTLESIELWEMENFIGVIHRPEMEGTVLTSPPLGQGVFSSLTHLIVSYCPKIKKVGLPLSVFQNLEVLVVKSCDEIEEMTDDEGREAKARVVSLPKLKRLYLRWLPKLKSICNATVNCTSIEEIYVRDCPKFKKLPFHEVPPPTLRRIHMHKEEWESLEWEHPTLRHPLQHFLRYL